MENQKNQAEITIKYIHAIAGEPDLADEWHIFAGNDVIGIMFSREWADRIAAGLELVRELAEDMRKDMNQVAEEVVRGQRANGNACNAGACVSAIQN
jgi:hypothetical protein